MLEKLQEIARECTGNENLTLKGEMSLVDDLELNSLELAELLCEVEDLYGIEIPDRLVGSLKTVKDVLNYIEGAVKNAK